MKVSSVVLSAFAVLLSPALGEPSSKFAAIGSKDTVTLLDITQDDDDVSLELASSLLATIKPSGNDKELLIGVSAVSQIITFTEAVATNKGGKAEAVAEAGIYAFVRLAPIDLEWTATAICKADTGGTDIWEAFPGKIPFNTRKQELAVEVDLDIVCAVDECEVSPDDFAIEGTVGVSLGIETWTANSFNFIAPNVPQGSYAVVACYEGYGGTSLTNNDDGSAKAKLALAGRTVTIEQVRAISKWTDVDLGA